MDGLCHLAGPCDLSPRLLPEDATIPPVALPTVNDTTERFPCRSAQQLLF